MTNLRLISLVILVVTLVASVSCGTSIAPPIDKETSKDALVPSSPDFKAEKRNKDITTVVPASGVYKPILSGNNTLIIQLQADTPLKEIIIDEALIAGGSDPIFDIDGNPSDSGSGAIRIGTLTMENVDARRLEIRDTQVVSNNMTNVVAHDDELSLNIETVTVVFVEQGTSSSLSLKNLRIDRIRILGVGNGVDTYLERLTITRSSFLGKIRIEDVKIDSLILKNISLED